MAGSYGARFKAIDDKLQELKCLPALVQQLSDKVAVFIQERESARQRNKDHTERRRPRTWAGEYQPPTRFIRMEFPRFQRSDVIGWIQECERYFELEGTPDNERVRLARKNLDEKGYIWDLAFMEEEGGRRVSWQKYKQALQVRFGPLNDERIPRTETWNKGGSIPKPSNVIEKFRTSETWVSAETTTYLPSDPEQPIIIQEVFAIQERGGSCSDSTNECVEVQEASVCTELTESGSNSFHEGDEIQDVTSSSSDFDVESSACDLVSDFRNPKTWKCPKTGEGVDDLLCFDTIGSSLGVSSLSLQVESDCRDSAKETTPVAAPSTTPSSLTTPILVLPLSSSSSPEAFVSFPSLSCLPSSLYLFDAIVPLLDFPLAERSEHGSMKEDERVVWEAKIFAAETELAFTWVTKGQIEGSKIAEQLVSIINSRSQELTQLSKVQFEKSSSQLVPIFFFSDQLLGFEGAYMSPITPMGIIKNGLLQRAFSFQYSPTKNLLHTWFRGKLMAMLYGRSCSLSSKKRGKTLG